MTLRIVTLNSFMPGFRLVSSWAGRHGHQIVLVVTTPIGTDRRYDATSDPFVLGLPPGTDILLTGKLRSVAAPVIAALEPDLVISAAYPRLIPPEILDIPRYGALNLHPSALPAGRGPNPFRLVYEGATTIGATLHRTAREFDTGPVLSLVSGPLPDPLTPQTLYAAQARLLGQALEQGTARALAGDPGTPQDDTHASSAPAFTEADELLDLAEPGAVIRRRFAALNMLGPRARVLVDGTEVLLADLYGVPPDDQTTADAKPGMILASHPDGWTVQTADDALRLVTPTPREP
jgi:methionyl-tRNA formyltransferase